MEMRECGSEECPTLSLIFMVDIAPGSGSIFILPSSYKGFGANTLHRRIYCLGFMSTDQAVYAFVSEGHVAEGCYSKGFQSVATKRVISKMPLSNPEPCRGEGTQGRSELP